MTESKNNKTFKNLASYWYREADILGKGAYGAVLKAYDERTATVTGEAKEVDGVPKFLFGAREVALKRMANTNLEDGLSASTIREIMVLRELAHRLRSDQRSSCVIRCDGLGTFYPNDTTAEAGRTESANSVKPRKSPNDWSTTFCALSDDSSDDEEFEEEAAGSQPADNMWGAEMESFLSQGRFHLIEMYDVIVDRESNAIFAALEYCDGGDLWSFLKNRPNRRVEDPILFKRWIREMLQGLAFMHDRHLTHRDLKPQNLMLKTIENQEKKETGENFYIKIGDFGLSRIEDIPVKKYAHEAITLWYRSPDVLLGNTNFSYSADAWSMGCIIAELASGAALFRGRDQEDQLKRVFARTGVPDTSVFPDMHNYPYSNDFEGVFELMENFATDEKNRGTYTTAEQTELKALKSKHLCEHNRRCSQATLGHLAGIKARLRACLTQRGNFDVLDEDGLDLISRLLLYDPNQRMTILEALQHPFVRPEEELFDSPAPPNGMAQGKRSSITSGGSNGSGPTVSESISIVPKPPNHPNKSAPTSNKSSTAGLLPHIPPTTASAEIHAPTAAKRTSKVAQTTGKRK